MLKNKTVKKKLVTVDCSEEEPEEIPYAESSNYDCVKVSEK